MQPGQRRGRRGRASPPAPLCGLCHLLKCALFQASKHHHLSVVYRQASDEPYRDFLNEVRVARPTQQQIDSVLGPCFKAEGSLDSLLTADATLVCTHR